MSQPVAVVLVVFGGGLRTTPGGYALSPASMARVQAAADYVARHAAAFRQAARPRIVFTGGWAEASHDAPEPPPGHREADLMLRQAKALDLDDYATLIPESRSRSTLENLLNIANNGLLDAPAYPLGLVSHPWHLPRVRFLAGKVLGLRGAALLDIPAGPDEDSPAGLSPRLVYAAARLGYLTARRPAQMLRRERRIVAVARKVEKFRRRLGNAHP